jgi:hypothetical protein
MTDDATVEHPLSPPQYWLLWVLSNVTSWLVWALLNFGLLAVISVVNPPSDLGLLISVAFLLAVGAVLGGTQWLLLRQEVPLTTRWIIFTALGFALGAFFDVTFAGLGVGLAQWLLLRNVLNKAGWWPVINAVAWLIGYLIGNVLGAAVNQFTNSITLAAVAIWGVSGAIFGALTGAMLLWLLRENRLLLDGLRAEAKQAKKG